jgi:hypothetical protein
MGAEFCLADGRYGACDCAACSEGTSQACTCADGRAGIATCEGDLVGECECLDPAALPCVPGARYACSCVGGAEGTQDCSVDRTLEHCQCGASRCEHGRIAACPCPGAEIGGTECWYGSWQPCQCRGTDAALPPVPDAAVVLDAGLPPEPECPACGCTPPVVPMAIETPSVSTITSPGLPLGWFPFEEGYVVVTAAGASLYGRDGTVRSEHRTGPLRPYLEAVRYDAFVAAVTETQIDVLAPTMTLIRSIPLVHSRVAGLPGNAWPLPCHRLLHFGGATYDLDTSRVVERFPAVGLGIDAAVPDRDAFLSSAQYARWSGAALVPTSSGPGSRALAVGHSSIFTSDRGVLSLDGCADGDSTHCLAPLRWFDLTVSLATYSLDQSFYFQTTARGLWRYEPTSGVLSFLGEADEVPNHLDHDPWGNVLIARSWFGARLVPIEAAP